ncbi:MAG: glycosyltransferase [Candidatus Eisenbacteria bacterium]|nr:glycosyltransferase [Candidatus Eisenbacteria bacterium]
MAPNGNLRVLCVAQNIMPDRGGGVERVAHEMMKRLSARGHVVDLVGQRSLPGSPDVEEFEGVRIHRYGSAADSARFGGRTLSALRKAGPVIDGLISTNSYDVVMPHHFFPYRAYQRVAGPPTAPEIVTFHASFWQELKVEGAERAVVRPLESMLFGGLARRSEAACLRRADRVVVLSEFSREQLASYYPFALDKVVKIPGGVDLERFRPAADRLSHRRRLGLPEDRSIVFTARRLVPRMGLPNLIAAFAGIAASDPSALLVVAGKGRLESSLRDQVEELGIADSVSFVGFVPDDELVRYYQTADLFVLPTMAFEGFGMVTLEALACGTPALGTPVGATPEILTPLAPQLVLDGSEPMAIMRGLRMMLEWLSDPSEASGLRIRCRRYVEEKYDWESSVDLLENLARGLVRRGGSE